VKDITYLAIAYLGMIAGIAYWTWTVFAKSKSLEAKISSLEKAITNDESE
tara:strand:- start:517 stop:666 length:150 start_codon:yes stop_codon:yes gene_type:complete